MCEKTKHDITADFTSQSGCSTIEGESDGDVPMELRFCPNKREVIKMQSTLRQLQRVGTLAGTEWIAGPQETICSLVLPHYQNHKSDEDASMYQMQDGSKLYEPESKKPDNPI